MAHVLRGERSLWWFYCNRSIILMIVVAIICCGCAQKGGDDRSCLMALKDGLQDAKGSLASWNGKDLNTPCYNQSLSSLTGITCNNDRVYSLQLNSKGLRGSISPSISNCSFLSLLDFSDNNLKGEMPSELGSLLVLSTLNMSFNDFSGIIPESLANCTYLNVLDLRKNGLTGSIPIGLGYLQRLRVFDVSDNDLSGPIPILLANSSSGPPRFNITSFRGNKKLYGYPLPPPKQHNLSVLGIVGIGLGSGMLSLLLSFTAVCIWLRVSDKQLAAEEGKISQLMPGEL